jgi:transketolase
VSLALAAHERLAKDGVRARVVSMPCWETFAAQDPAYRDQVLPPAITARVSIEAGVTFGWERWIGPRGVAIGVDRYGASAPAEVIFEHLGFTPAHVAEVTRELVGRVRAGR